MRQDIESLVYDGVTPWEGFGEYVGGEGVSSNEALERSGLNWSVKKSPLVAIHDESQVTIDSHRAVVRDSDESILGVVGKDYHLLQNADAFGFLDSLVEEGEVRYHTAGTLRDGRRIWVLATLPGCIETVSDDCTHKYLLLVNSHDGSMKFRCFFTAIRAVCANTVQAAVLDPRGQGISLRHSKNMHSRLEESREIIARANDAFESYDEFTKKLVSTAMNDSDWDEFALKLFPNDDGGGKPMSNARASNARDELKKLFFFGRGQGIPGVRGTAWAALNAVTEYVNYRRTTRGGQDRRFESAVFGTGSDFVHRAATELSQLVA